LQFRIGRSWTTGGYSGGLNATGVSSDGSSGENYRIGLGYSVTLSDRFMITPAVDFQRYSYGQAVSFSGISNADNESFLGITGVFTGGDEFVVSLPVSYSFYNRSKSSLSAVLGLELKQASYGGGNVSYRINEEIMGAEINYVANEHIRGFRAAIATGLNYDVKLGRMPLRIQALYSHALSDHVQGNYTYSNEFTGENRSGRYAFKGHQFTASLQFSPFGNGKSKKPGVENIKRVRNTAVGSTRFGVRTGVTFNTIDATDSNSGGESGFASTNGYASLFADTRISESWNLQSEFGLNFAADGYILAENAFLFKRRVAEKLSLYSGPKIVYLLDGPAAVKARSSAASLGLTLGVQYDFTDSFFVEGRYSRNFGRQFNDPNFTFENGNLNSLQIGVGLKF